jgi:hypothetical protein
MSPRSNYDKHPCIPVRTSTADYRVGWRNVIDRLKPWCAESRCTLAFECYPCTFEGIIKDALVEGLRPTGVIFTSDLLTAPHCMDKLLAPVWGDDPVFGRMNGHWVVSLTTRNALLLSEPPRCGKTDTARYVAAEFQALGYNVREGSDVEEALRYLLDAEPGDRLFLLDDPPGGLHVEPGSTGEVKPLTIAACLAHFPPHKATGYLAFHERVFSRTETQIFTNSEILHKSTRSPLFAFLSNELRSAERPWS